jgi:hypothetical protein
MSGALLVLGGIAYIGLSLFFKFTPRLRVLVGLLVGGLLAGVVTDQVITWLGKGTGAVAGPLGNLIGQSPRSTATAIPTVIAFVLAVVVVVFLRGRKGGAGGGKHGGGGKAAGGGGRAGGLATVALVCALLLPIVAGSVGEAIRSVT